MNAERRKVVKSALEIVEEVASDIRKAAQLTHLEDPRPSEQFKMRDKRVRGWTAKLEKARGIVSDMARSEQHTRSRSYLVDAYRYLEEVVKAPEPAMFNELFYGRLEAIRRSCRLATA